MIGVLIKMKNVVIFAETEEQMQGIIRGIEQLDENHEVGIIYGSYTDKEISEALKVLIDVAEATVVHTGFLTVNDTMKEYVLKGIPNDERTNVIDYLTSNKKGIIKDLTS